MFWWQILTSNKLNLSADLLSIDFEMIVNITSCVQTHTHNLIEHLLFIQEAQNLEKCDKQIAIFTLMTCKFLTRLQSVYCSSGD